MQVPPHAPIHAQTLTASARNNKGAQLLIRCPQTMLHHKNDVSASEGFLTSSTAHMCAKAHPQPACRCGKVQRSTVCSVPSMAPQACGTQMKGSDITRPYASQSEPLMVFMRHIGRIREALSRRRSTVVMVVRGAE